MEEWNLLHTMILVLTAGLCISAILVNVKMSNKGRTIYDKHLHSKPRDGDNT